MKKLKGSLVPDNIEFEKWAMTASVKDLVAEMQFQNAKLTKVLEGAKKKKKNA